MSFISFLIQGTQCSLLQEMQVDKQLSQVSIVHGGDQRTLDTIKINDTFLSQSGVCHSIIARNNETLMTIDYSCIDKAAQTWKTFHRYTLYTLIATTAVLAGLVTLSLSRVVKTPLLVLAQLAVAVFCAVVFHRADTIYRNKPLFAGDYNDYTLAIQKFRNEVIKNGWLFLTNESSRLPYELRDRRADFFTENEKTLLAKV